ncbi:histidine kinase [Yeosuana sp. MJ-SS3]|uniref:Histidine kinase n=1 Tax=Gilvirhabdus luticola TaxID=3079858 RepID=A0ABU3U3U3_9FLAO|nr:ATP-binding protein [Yeosuana sp. MJ-SS3]MDU8885077.1 histidine kinase [Yeosuana sp. MJ-SS3]
MKLKTLLFLILLSFFSYSQENVAVVDSIEFYLNESNKNTVNDFEIKLNYITKAKELAELNKIDSLLVKTYIILSNLHLQNNNDTLFLKYNHKGLKLAKINNDSTHLARINKNLGYYYFEKLVDSAYYYDNQALKLYSNRQDKLNTAIVLLDIALLQKNNKDYTGSELISVRALTLLDQLRETDQVKRYKSYFYNNLAILYKELQQFDESIKYNLLALDLNKQLKGDNSRIIEGQKNNLANVYKNSEQYDLAIDYYLQIMANQKLINEHPDFYALVLDNYAHTLYLSNDYSELPNLFLKALKICDSIGDNYKSIVINQHLAEYYNDVNKKDSAKYYAYRAKEISEPNYTDELLESLLLLSKIEDDSIAVKYYDAYVELNDSLIKNERAIRNKFARIQYETEKIEQENAQIARERMWLMILSGGLIVTLLLLYIIITQRAKNKELRLVQQQQEANEEIYNLMLSQQDKIEEARTLEKSRISQELHDGVLGRLFGTRLSLDSLNMNTNPEAVKTRGQYIEELKNIEQDIRKVSHELSTDFIGGSGFMDIVKTLIDTQTKAYKLKYKLDFSENINWDKVPNKTKIHVYRIVQESLQNIYKHANANTVKVSFILKNNVICLSIADDGSGFDVKKAKKGIGIKNITSRVDEIHGKLAINSKKNVGTKIEIQFPTKL